jgi:predicted histone-like DNA-binding protein
MPVLFRPTRSNFENKEGKKLYYPKVVNTGTVTIKQLAEEIAALSSLSAGDVKNTISNLVTVMTQHMQSSEIVSLEGLGTFRFVMKSAGNGVETPDEVSSSQANLTVRFCPSSTRNANGTVANRTLVTGSKCVRYDKLSSYLTVNGAGSGSSTESGSGDSSAGGGQDNSSQGGGSTQTDPTL